ncbi:hypothetical protein F4782DRAFT_264428 [Xylaria castorea]|nr:hypothetical protein F4782DRAFT_264428 [Xylaria castorea]
MYSKMNTVAVVGLLAAGAMGQSSSSHYMTLPSTSTSAPVETVPTSSTEVTSTTHPVTTSSVVEVDPPSMTTSMTTSMGDMHHNGSITTAVWSYFNVTVTSVTVVEEFTTLCKEATTLTFNDCAYPATAGEVIVVTNCPCTVTTALPTWTSSLCPPETAKPAPPTVEVTYATPAPPVTPTHSVSVEKPSYTAPPAIQVAGASPVGNGDIAGFAIAAVAVVLGFF